MRAHRGRQVQDNTEGQRQSLDKTAQRGAAAGGQRAQEKRRRKRKEKEEEQTDRIREPLT